MLQQRARDRLYKRAVGALVIVSALALLVFLRLYQQTAGQFRAPLRLHAVTERGDGIVLDAPVTMAGIRVGRVGAIHFTDDNRVRLALDIERHAADKLRADSRATLSRPLIGATVVDVSMGSPNQPALVDGAVLPTTRTADLNEVIATLPDRLAKVDVTLDNLAAVSADLRRLSREAAAPDGPVATTLHHAEAVARKAEAASQQLAVAIDDVRGVVRQAGETMTSAQAALTDVRAGTARVPAVAGQLEAAVDDVRTVTRELRSVAPDIAPLVGASRDTLDEADDVLQAARNSILLRGNLPPAPAPAGVPAPR